MKNNYIAEELENNFFNSLFSIASKTWVNITISNFVYMLISLLIVGGVFASTLGTEALQVFSPEMQQNPELIQEVMLNQYSNFETSSFIGGMLTSLIVMLLVASWMQYFSYNATTEYLRNGNKNFVSILKQSFDAGLFRMLGVSLLLSIMLVLLSVLVGFSTAISGLLAFLFFIGVYVLFLRLILVIPAFVIGKRSLSESFAFSFAHISWFKALKYFGITLLAFLVLIAFGFIISFFGLFLNMIPYLGVAIQYLIQIITGGFFVALGAALFVGLYFRATGELKSTEEAQPNNDDLTSDALPE